MTAAGPGRPGEPRADLGAVPRGAQDVARSRATMVTPTRAARTPVPPSRQHPADNPPLSDAERTAVWAMVAASNGAIDGLSMDGVRLLSAARQDPVARERVRDLLKRLGHAR